MDALRESVLPAWKGGIDHEKYSSEKNEYVIQFTGRPWAEKTELASECAIYVFTSPFTLLMDLPPEPGK